MKKAIASIHYAISKSQYSHRGSWPRIWGKLTNSTIIGANDDWKDYDMILLYHGMEWSGALNMFGGAKDPSPFQKFLDAKNGFMSLDIPCPDFGALGKARCSSGSKEWNDFDWNALTEKCRNMPVVRMYKLGLQSLIVGDSHANSVWMPDTMVDRNDAKTLHGALQYRLVNYVSPYIAHLHDGKSNLKHITFYFGNIDIRHHILRRRMPTRTLHVLLREYEKQIQEVVAEFKIPSIEVVCPLPIENVSRRIPKTGWYKNTPYYGSQEERQHLVDHMTQQIERFTHKHGWKCYKHPKTFLNDQKELSFDVMEKPQSVHIAPKFYRGPLC